MIKKDIILEDKESLYEICKTEYVNLSKTPIKPIYPKKE